MQFAADAVIKNKRIIYHHGERFNPGYDGVLGGNRIFSAGATKWE